MKKKLYLCKLKNVKIMKTKVLFLALLLLLTGRVAAQTSPCGIVITGDFDSECVHDFKGLIPDEYPPLMVACKYSTVTYTATAEAGVSVVGWLWYVDGDVSHNAAGNQVVVNWSNDDMGMVAASAITSDGDTCTATNFVKLIDIPEIAAATIPAYTVMPDGSKVIRVCKGSRVEFIDCSSAGQSDIAGYSWRCYNAGPSSTSTYVLENVTMADVVTHRVYNNCGCYDEETYYIEIMEGDILQLECYGTVCKGDVVKYNAVSPVCAEYSWYVDGGTLLDGQNSDSPTVQWSHPHDGYGVIGLDGVFCGDEVCPTLMSVRIPVLHDSIAIAGPSELCVGEVAVYTLPVFGSTEYEWTVTPTMGINTTMVNESNKITIVAEQAGTYTISASYRCNFLDCGPYASLPLTVTVRPNLEIAGGDEICLSNPCDLHSVPSVAVTWSVYDLNDNNAPVTVTGINPSTALQMTMPHKGSFLVTASHPDYCGPATFMLHVGDVPAPTVAELDPDNRHTVCVGSGLVLRGTPSNPDYDLVWMPVCSTAVPQQYAGNNVTVGFPVEACDVRVYNYDRVQQCLSSQYYVHTVSELTPALLNIPNPVTACPGSRIVWGNAEVPDQRSEGMLYEWTIQDVVNENMQRCASVQGSHLQNSISFTVNEVMPQPIPFTMKLRRTYCGTKMDTYITINVSDNLSSTVSIAGPASVCAGSSATFTGSGGSDASHYMWTIEEMEHNGNPVSHTFHHEGTREVEMTYNPYTYCTNKNLLGSATHIVNVIPRPLVEKIVYNAGPPSYMSLSPSMSVTDFDFAWYYSATMNYDPGFPLLPLGTNATFPYMGNGYYRCVVTDKVTGCSTEVTLDYACNNTLLLSHSNYNPCTHSITLSTPDPSSPVVWHVTNGVATLEPSGYNNYQCTVTAESIGYITVEASVGIQNCRRGYYTFLVDFIPDFTFRKRCGYIIIENNSHYHTPGTIGMTVNGTPFSFSASNREVRYPALGTIPGNTTYNFMLASYDGNPISCGNTWSVYFENISRTVTVSSANPSSPNDKTCNNTPIMLTASLSPTAVVTRCEWDFGDNSSLEATGASVYHTFKENNTYYVSVTAVDEYGCSHTANNALTIKSYDNNLVGQVDQQPLNIVCPGSLSRLDYSLNTPNNYYWRSRTESPFGTAGGQYYYPTQPEVYIAYVTDEKYCKHEASAFANFLNKPEAKIIADRNTYCEGSEIKLYGKTPSSNQLSYLWTIGSETYTDADITATAHDDGTGTMTVSLLVTDNSSTCTALATRVFTITPQPAAPVISVTGNPCISDAPVQLGVTGFSGTVSWNNGDTGPSALYYTPGPATVYYYDPMLGCPSEEASLDIARQPDLNALLTGCYEKCKDQTSGRLPVYGLTGHNQTIDWLWERNGNTVASGSGCYFINPLLLPLGTGDHTLTVGYPDPICIETSATLSIAEKETCDCDSVDVTWTIEPAVENCIVHYTVHFTICNHSEYKSFCIENAVVSEYNDNVDIIYNGLTNINLAPGDCDTGSLYMKIIDFIPPMLNITLVDDNCYPCSKRLAIDLMPETECTIVNLENQTYFVAEDLSSAAATYIVFNILMPSANVLAFWSEPPMVVDYTVGATGVVSGLGMLDRALLSQLATADSSVCFYAILCVDEELCMVEYCIEALEIKKMIEILEESAESKTMQQAEDDSPQLRPNPASGSVHVTGTADKVVELAVMDMHGRKVATFADTDAFDTQAIATGSYIVRITTEKADGSQRVTYRKLIVID